MIVFLVTFTLFTIEAFIHYNFGQEKVHKDGKLNFPEKKELVKIIGTVFIFSSLTSIIVRILHKKFHIYK